MKKQSKNSLVPKPNGKGRISSYTLNVSLEEAKLLGISNDYYPKKFYIKKEIVDNKLVISRAFPQTANDFIKILDDFHIIGKRISDRMLLDLLYFIEGNSESYIKQKNKSFASIRYLGRGWIAYKGQYAYFDFKVKTDKNHVITNFESVGPSFLPDF